eukprot:3053978-Amphidinium_carterae.1
MSKQFIFGAVAGQRSFHVKSPNTIYVGKFSRARGSTRGVSITPSSILEDISIPIGHVCVTASKQ